MAAAWPVSWLVYAAHMILMLATALLALRGRRLAGFRRFSGINVTDCTF
ncbi:MAG: hypothetical protein Q4B94_10580 [Pseudomonadota bacterium]|nr:hypothetical protein [Pseudomonadota bacterium]